ncbi:hypothetical protein EO220_2975 [Saccharomyces cerevisiae PE-2]|nr:hypothetical protein EO220_2975 [Saccharomyces cerevisiae PE-2]
MVSAPESIMKNVENIHSSRLTNVKSVLSATELSIIRSNANLEKPSVPSGCYGRILRKLEVPHDGKPISILRNPDLEPIKLRERKWGFWSFFAYWALPNCSIGTLSTGSALLALNLNVKESIGVLVVSNIIVSLFTIACSNPGIKYHIGYTLDQRLLFGIYGSYLTILIRVGLSIVLYAYLSWMGGLCVNMVFNSFSVHYLNMKNIFPDSVPFVTKDFVGFLCFQLIQMPFSFVRPSLVNVPSIVASLMSLAAVVGMFAYLLTTNSGPGPLYNVKIEMSTKERAWAWIFGITIWYSGVAAPVSNQSDYSRFATGGPSSYWGLSLGSILLGVFVPVSGLICASACKQLYGQAYWSPDQIVTQWLNDSYSAKSRAAAFFIGISFTGSQLFFNLTQNGYSCGMDLAGILPKYINVTRGTLFVQLISWLVQPWTFFNSSSAFLNAVSSFGIFTTPIVAINAVEFFYFRRSTIPLIDFFTLSKEGTYWYTSGFNWKSILSLLAGISLGIPGLVYQVNTGSKINTGMQNFYYGYIFFSPLVSGGLYLILTHLFPVRHEKMCKGDPVDFFNCFNDQERQKMGMLPCGAESGGIYEYLDGEECEDTIEQKGNFIITDQKKSFLTRSLV